MGGEANKRMKTVAGGAWEPENVLLAIDDTVSGSLAPGVVGAAGAGRGPISRCGGRFAMPWLPLGAGGGFTGRCWTNNIKVISSQRGPSGLPSWRRATGSKALPVPVFCTSRRGSEA